MDTTPNIQTTPPPKPPQFTDNSPQVIDYPIMLSGHRIATLRLPYPIKESDWERIEMMLPAIKLQMVVQDQEGETEKEREVDDTQG